MSKNEKSADSTDLLQTALLLLLVAGFLAAYFPVWSGLIRAWSNSDDYSHGFAIVPLSLYILWQKRDELSELEITGNWGGLFLASLSLLMYLMARKAELLTLAPITMILFLWGTTIFLFGFSMFKAAFFPLLILFFMIPVPSQIIAALTMPLQLLVTKSSVFIATHVGVPVLYDGNVIETPEGTFEVVQACSGLRSIMTMLTLGALLGYFTLRSNLLRTMLFFLAVPIAILVNILRVFILISALHFWNINLASGTPHTFLGLGVFIFAFFLFIVVQKGLARCER